MTAMDISSERFIIICNRNFCILIYINKCKLIVMQIYMFLIAAFANEYLVFIFKG